MKADFIRWLYGWRKPPAEAMRDVAALRADPAERLARGPVEFGPARTTLALTLFVVGIALVVVFLVTFKPRNDQERLKIGTLAFAYAAIVLWVGVTVWTIRGSRLILDAGGVVFANRRRLLFCPWTLFNAAGVPFSDPDKPHRLEMPINPAAIPEIVLRRPNGSERRGKEAKTNEFRIGKQESLKLCLFYAIDAQTLVPLLLHVGRRMTAHETVPRAAGGATVPATAAPGESEPVWTGGDNAVVIDHNDWITIDAVRARFPPLCCLCGGSTTESHRFSAKAGFLDAFREPASISIPCCAPCERTLGPVQRRGVWLVFGLILLLSLISYMQLIGPGWVVVAAIIAILAMFSAHQIFSPVRARYQPLTKRFSFWFRQPGYAEQVRSYIRNPSAWRPPEGPPGGS